MLKILTTDWVNVRHPKPSKEEVIKGSLEDQTKGFGINASYRYPKQRWLWVYWKTVLSKNVKAVLKLGMEATNIRYYRKKKLNLIIIC